MGKNSQDRTLQLIESLRGPKAPSPRAMGEMSALQAFAQATQASAAETTAKAEEIYQKIGVDSDKRIAITPTYFEKLEAESRIRIEEADAAMRRDVDAKLAQLEVDRLVIENRKLAADAKVLEDSAARIGRQAFRQAKPAAPVVVPTPAPVVVPTLVP